MQHFHAIFPFTFPSWCKFIENKDYKMDTQQITVRSEEPGNFLKNQLCSLVPPRMTGFCV